MQGLSKCELYGQTLQYCLEQECPYVEQRGKTGECVHYLHEDAQEVLKRPDCEHAEHDSAGCLGYAGCNQDDEPIEICKKCDAYTGNKSERAVKWDEQGIVRKS